jgi:TrmH family RNA methyltransferase
VRGSAGLHYALPVLAVDDLEGLTGPLIALDADGGPWQGLPDDAVLCVGSERAGLSAAVRDRAGLHVALPMRPGVSSLNLATAVSAALYAWRLGGPAASG